jgi:hypothetical protein
VNWLKSGPELKMPELKVPTFLVDLYWDLRERHLLPLVVLAIVAIVAVPFLLGGGSKEQAGSPASPLGAAPSPEPAGSKLTVVEAKPGLRDPSKRLRADKPTDPFVQRYTAPVLTGTQLGNGEEEGGSSSTSSSTSTSTSTTVTKTSSNGKTTEVTTENGSPGGTAQPGHLTLFAFAIDVKIVRTSTTADGGKDRGEPDVRHRVVPPAALPSEKTQVVTYMGISPKTRAPMLLISDAVTSVFGEAKCLSGTSACQLIEVEPGMPMTFVYGPDSVRYKITVLKVEPVVAGHT